MGNIFGWLTQLWRPSNHWDKWFTCPPTASIKMAEERAGQVHISPREPKNLLKRVTARETPITW
jgi:hypothetical protein